MKPKEIPRKPVQTVTLRPVQTVTLRPVFRYSVSSTRGRAWVWLTGAALIVAVAATLVLPKMI